MEWWQAVVLGLVEGITEYLPISSTGHLILASALMKLDTPAMKNAVDDFNIVIQGGAILAVLGLYRTRVKRMFAGVIGRDPAGFKLAVHLLIAFLPAAVVGFFLHDTIEARLFRAGPVLAAVLLGGIFMMLVDAWCHGRFSTPRPASAWRDLDAMTWHDALRIGLLQCIAMWPGTSRSMMTITGGVISGLKPAAAAEFSFLLGLPTLGAAMVYSLAKNLLHARQTGEPNLFETLGVGSCVLGLIVAAVSAAVAVKWLVGFLNRHGLTPFGWYRVALFVVLAGAISAGWVAVAP